MIDKSLREAGPPDTYDNTMISNFLCNRQLYWFLRRVTYASTPAYFTFGRAFGQGINKWHESEDSSLSTLERKFLALGEAQRIWEKEAPVEKSNDTFSNLSWLVDKYCEIYEQPEQWKMLGAEVGFRLPIPGTSLYYAGSLDSYIEWPGYGLLIREDKSTGDYLANFVAQWGHASQVTGYIWALSQILGEAPFGTLMNYVSKRPRKDPFLRFGRHLETRSEWKIKNFMAETVGIIDLIRKEWEPGQWKWSKTGERYSGMCTGGPGRSPCAYRNLCILDSDPWEMEAENFAFHGLVEENKPWEPWEREGDDD